MSQSERERALVNAGNALAESVANVYHKTVYPEHCPVCVAAAAWKAALDTPQEPTPAAPPDDATPRPWHVHRGGNFVKVVPEGWEEMVKKNGYYGGAICDMDDWSEREGQHNHEMVSVGANAELIVAAVNALAAAPEPTPAAPPDAKHLPKGNLLGDTANELAKIAEALKTTNALRGREVFEIAVRIGWWANAVKALEAQDAAAPRPALSPDAAASSGDDKGEGR